MFKYTSIHTVVCLHGKWLVFLLLLGGLSTVWSGCGKKAPPVPPKRPPLPVVQDLRYTIHEGNMVELSWTLPVVSDSSVAEIQVLRATQSGEEIGCQGCPLRFRIAAEIPIHHKAFAKSEPRALRFTEEIDPGYRYMYKVIALDEYGMRSKDSNMVIFDH